MGAFTNLIEASNHRISRVVNSQLMAWILAISIFADNASGATQAEIVFVNTAGNDTTGDGSFDNPFLTVQTAINSIPDASAVKPYEVSVAPGIYASPFVLSPFIFVVGAGQEITFLAPTAAQVLGAGFAGAGVKTAGIHNASLTTNVVANFAAIGSTGTGKISLVNLTLGGVLTLTGATATTDAYLNNVNWQQANFKTVTITEMANVDMSLVNSAFGALVIAGTDAFFKTVSGNGVSGFLTLTITWTGSNANNALQVIMATAPNLGTTGAGGFGQPVISGLGAIFSCPAGTAFNAVNVTTEIQFNRFSGTGAAGGVGAINGVDLGVNHIIFGPAAPITLTVRRPTNGTRLCMKNQSAFAVTLDFGALGITGDPSYIGPYGYAEVFFSSGTWMVEEQQQSGTAVLVNGVSALIPADISASSVIVCTLKTFSGAAGIPAALSGGRVNGTRGAGGGFVITSFLLATGAVVATDQGTYDWHVFPGRA
jgi:hypothetical protein